LGSSYSIFDYLTRIHFVCLFARMIVTLSNRFGELQASIHLLAEPARRAIPLTMGKGET
jgi:hypothetical protein